MRKNKHVRLTLTRETLQQLDPAAERSARRVVGGAVQTRNGCTTVTFTDWPTCDPIT
jgi:hypothetical protein